MCRWLLESSFFIYYMRDFKRILISFSAFIFLIKERNKKESFLILRIGENKFSVEIVDTVIAQALGLSGRPSLPENQGMLFVFDGLAIRNFWMAGMRFPLD